MLFENFPPKDIDGRYSFRSMFSGWLMLMIPLAAVTWAQTRSIVLTVISFVFLPMFAILQGALGILSYRHHFGDSPMPHTPAHGLVIVNGKDRDSETEMEGGNIGCQCMGGQRWRRGGPLNAEDEAYVARVCKEPPLRLLVIGDSLAIGVGTSRSCTPQLPECIARTLSKECGRAVLWTSHGAAGASAQWVVRELQRGVKHLKPKMPVFETPDMEFSDASSSEESSLVDQIEPIAESLSTITEEEHEATQNGPIDWQGLRAQMARHRQRFDPKIKGPYDVVVVLTGSNDLKAAFFPFLLKGEEAEFQKAANKRGGAYSTELRRLLLALSRRMNMTLMKDDTDGHPDPEQTLKSPKKSANGSLSVDTSKVVSSRSRAPPTPSNFKRPLLVLPGNPAAVIPSFQVYPLKWLSSPMVAITDNAKRDLAKDNSRHVLFVDPPTDKQIGKYEDQRGHIWEKREKEDTLVALRDVTRASCQRVEGTMRSYFGEKGGMYGHQPLFQCEPVQVEQHNPMVPKLSERPGRMSSKIFSIDGVHTNDEGYDFWGRFIGDAIVNELRRNTS